MAPESTISQHELAQMVGEIPLPCYYADWSHCGPAQARWVMHVRCNHCGVQVARLACGPCKNILVSTEDALTCPTCDEVHAPARRAFARIEWLT